MTNDKENVVEELDYKQRRAIYLLVSCQQEVDEVARVLNVSQKEVKGWMEEPMFKEKLEKVMGHLEAHDAKYRANQNRHITSAVYEEVHRRVSNGEDLTKLNFATLIKCLKDLSHEVRLDTPEDVTSKVDHKHGVLDDLIARFNDSESTKYSAGLRLVEDAPNKSKKEKVSNG